MQMKIYSQTEKEDSLKEVQRTGSLPKVDKPDDVALAVYQLYRHMSEAYAPWYEIRNEDNRYYRGEQLKKKPRHKSNVVDNEMKSLVDTSKSQITDAISDADILSLQEGDIDSAKALGQRIEFAERMCELKDNRSKIVHKILVDGGTYVKMNSDVSAYHIGSRRIMREPEASCFDEAHYYMDQVLSSAGNTIKKFGDAAKKLIPQDTELESEKNEPVGPPGVVGGSASTTFAPVGQTSPVHRYVTSEYDAEFKKADRILRLELWIRDNSTESVDGEADVEIYPEGRIVNVAVSAKDDGTPEEDPNLTVLMDRPNIFKKLYQNTGRFPFEEFLCYDTDDLWSQSIIRPVKPLQDKLNDVWNKISDNADVVINPKMITTRAAGITKTKLTNETGQVIILPLDCGLLPRDAVHWTNIPSIVHHLLPIVHELKDAIRDASGVLDVTRGEKPGGVTAASAINLLQVKADNRMLMAGVAISRGFKRIKESLAYIAQDFDDDMLEIPNESMTDKQEFTSYDPEDTRDTLIRVVGVRRKSMSELMQLLIGVAEVEQKTGMGELVLMYAEDPRLHDMYVKLKNEKAAHEQEIAEEQERKQVAESMGKQITDAMTKVQGSQNQETQTQ